MEKDVQKLLLLLLILTPVSSKALMLMFNSDFRKKKTQLIVCAYGPYR